MAEFISSDVIHTPDRPKEVKEAFSTIEKSENLLGFVDATPLKEGIKKTIKWAKKKGFQETRYSEREIDLQGNEPETWRNRLL